MSTRHLPHSIALQPPALDRIAAVFGALRAAASAARARWATHRHYRRLAQAERELAQLDERTLQDIGAPHGLIGQRRWQDERELTQAERLLHLRGW